MEENIEKDKMKVIILMTILIHLFVIETVAPPSSSPSPSPSPSPAPAPKPSYSTGSWGECSVSCGGGTQSRTVTCSKGNNGCSGSKPASTRTCNKQVCTCNPCKTVNIDNTTNALWTVPSNVNDYTNLNLTANVGDSILFKYSNSHDVYQLATKWHYDECNFEDAKLVGKSSDGSGDGFKYTVTGNDDKRRIYFACNVGSHCSLGQKAYVKIGNFEHATLKSANDRIEKDLLYDFNSIEQIWCFEEHCPDSAMSYYKNDAVKANKMCKADAQNLLGFVYRKKKSPNYIRSEIYYLKALQLVPDHCGARSYLGELYVQTNNKTFAKTTLNKLIEDCGNDSKETTSLVKVWGDKGWCDDLPSSVDKPTACAVGLGESAAASNSKYIGTKIYGSVFLSLIFGLVCHL